jgi:hypothetical protein
MMGRKERAFGPLPPIMLEDLVPPDHFYRHLERMLDLGFVRNVVRDACAEAGRPSIDPVVFCKLQLVAMTAPPLLAPFGLLQAALRTLLFQRAGLFGRQAEWGL